jgi:hypothetical protein
MVLVCLFRGVGTGVGARKFSRKKNIVHPFGFE